MRKETPASFVSMGQAVRRWDAQRAAASPFRIPTGRDVIPRWPFYAYVAVLGCECMVYFFADSVELGERQVIVDRLLRGAAGVSMVYESGRRGSPAQCPLSQSKFGLATG
jgi:hypothetical protein